MGDGGPSTADPCGATYSPRYMTYCIGSRFRKSNILQMTLLYFYEWPYVSNFERLYYHKCQHICEFHDNISLEYYTQLALYHAVCVCVHCANTCDNMLCTEGVKPVSVTFP